MESNHNYRLRRPVYYPLYDVGKNKAGSAFLLWLEKVVIAERILKLVPRDRIELPSLLCKNRALPLDERGINWKQGTESNCRGASL